MNGEVKKERFEAAVRRKRTQTAIWVVAALVAVAALVVFGVFWSQKRKQSLPGELVADQGREHIQFGSPHPAYNSNPPTSGWHYANPAEWGAYSEEIPDEVLVHNLEHGGIWVSYRPGIPEEIVAKLEGLYEEWGRKIVVAPRSANDADIALAAWNRLDKFSVSEYSDERVEEFIRAYRNKGPEFVP